MKNWFIKILFLATASFAAPPTVQQTVHDSLVGHGVTAALLANHHICTNNTPGVLTTVGCGTDSGSGADSLYVRQTAQDTAKAVANRIGTANGITKSGTDPNIVIKLDSTASSVGYGAGRVNGALAVKGGLTAFGSIPAVANNTGIGYVAGSTGQLKVHGPDNSTAGAFQLALLSANESVGDIYLSASSSGNFSTPGTWGFGTTATQQVSIHNGMNIFTGGTYAYSSATQGLNLGYDNNTEKSWIQSVREDFAHTRELQLNPGGGIVSVGPGAFNAVTGNFSGKVTNSDTTVMTLGARLPFAAGNGAGLAAISNTGKVTWVASPTTNFTPNVWFNLAINQSIEDTLVPDDGIDKVVGLTNGEGPNQRWTYWTKDTGSVLETVSATDSKIAGVYNYFASYCYSDCAEIGENIELDTVPNIAQTHQLNVNPGGGSMTVAMPGTDNVPEAYAITICSTGGGDSSVTFTFPGSSLAVGNASLPDVYLTNRTICKTFTVHNAAWYQTSSSTGKNP